MLDALLDIVPPGSRVCEDRLDHIQPRPAGTG
jgi:hypothetical protein